MALARLARPRTSQLVLAHEAKAWFYQLRFAQRRDVVPSMWYRDLIELICLVLGGNTG